MGYTHYWRRKKEFDVGAFARVVEDFKKVRAAVGPMVPLAGFDGEGDAEVTPDVICFNGVRECGHGGRNLGIAWPADDAKGVAAGASEGAAVADASPLATALTEAFGENHVATAANTGARNATGDSDVGGTWFAGCKLNARTCDGDCSHESFQFPRVWTDLPGWKREDAKDGLYFEFTKTAYKPYDLLVCAALVIADHHLKAAIRVSSDGTLNQWADARALCQAVLGYGQDFDFRDDD